MKNKGNVFINNEDLCQGKTARIIYNGPLSKANDELYIHLGFGNMWDNLSEVKMEKTSDGYVAEVPMIKADTLNFCFRDSKNNWDNNSCKNYSFEISKPKMIKATSKTSFGKTLYLSSCSIFENSSFTSSFFINSLVISFFVCFSISPPPF